MNKTIKDSNKSNNPSTRKNSYIFLSILEGNNKENVEYQSNFLENKVVDMEVFGVAKGKGKEEEVIRIIKWMRNTNNQATNMIIQ